MVGNSLRSDIEPVVRVGGWGVYMPYHVTWSHEPDHGLDPGHAHVATVESPAGISAALATLAATAARDR